MDGVFEFGLVTVYFFSMVDLRIFSLVTVYFFSLVTVFSLRILFGTMVDHHETIIWENMFQLFSKHQTSNSKYTQGICLFEVPPRHAFPHINCLEVSDQPP